MRSPKLAVFLLLTVLAGFGRAAEPHVLGIIGDSTVCDYPPESPVRGWGQYLAGHFGPDVQIVNLAASGRSTKTFLKQGLWSKMLAAKPEVILIQFGHNDSHGKAKPESTDAAADYRDYLRQYVTEARNAGAKPVLVTPMMRRTFAPDRSLQDNLKPYAEAMKMVATEMGAPLIDLFTMSGDLYRKLGPQKCLELASTPADATHFSEKGAQLMAELVMSRFGEAVPEWRDLTKP
jgi:lysophospholipase L1-like esterase